MIWIFNISPIFYLLNNFNRGSVYPTEYQFTGSIRLLTVNITHWDQGHRKRSALKLVTLLLCKLRCRKLFTWEILSQSVSFWDAWNTQVSRKRADSIWVDQSFLSDGKMRNCNVTQSYYSHPALSPLLTSNNSKLVNKFLLRASHWHINNIEFSCKLIYDSIIALSPVNKSPQINRHSRLIISTLFCICETNSVLSTLSNLLPSTNAQIFPNPSQSGPNSNMSNCHSIHFFYALICQMF